MVWILVGVFTVLHRIRQLGQLVDEVLVSLKLIVLINRLQLSFFFPRLGDFVPQFLDRALKFGLLPSEVIDPLRDVHQVCDALLLLLGFNFRNICHRGALSVTRNICCRWECFTSFNEASPSMVSSGGLGSTGFFQPSLSADMVDPS